MSQVHTFFLKFTAVTSLLFLSFSAFAGPGSVTLVPVNPTAVPTLSTSMLILMSVLLMIVALRVSKNKASGKLFITLMGASVLIASGSGVKLISDLKAGVESVVDPFTMPAGGEFTLFGDQPNLLVNKSTVPLRIKTIELPNSCAAFNPESQFSCKEGQILQSSLYFGLETLPEGVTKVDVGIDFSAASCSVDCGLISDEM